MQLYLDRFLKRNHRRKTCRILKDPVLQKNLERQGYVTTPLLTADQIETLSDLYEELRPLHETIGAPIYSTTDTNNEGLIRQVDKAIKNLISNSVDRLFCQYRVFIGSYLIKEPGENSGVYPHQDWTLVDESRYVSLSIWCPLIDVDESNGALQVIPGTQSVITPVRTSPDETFRSPFDESVHEVFHEYLQTVPLKAGEAVIYDHALIHASTPNRSQALRPAFVLGVLPNEAENFMHYKPDSDGKPMIEKYLVDNEFFMTYTKNNRPTNVRLLKIFEESEDQINLNQFLRIINR